MSTPRTHVSLDGPWTLVFDQKREGVKGRWFEKMPAGGKAISLPSMQSQGIEAHDGVGWYFRNFDYDEAFKGRFVSLDIGTTTFPTTVWLNGTCLGDHVGAGTPVAFSVGPYLKPGENLLAIRMELFEAMQEVVGTFVPFYPLDMPVDVGLQVLSKNHIQQVYLQPDIRRKRLLVNVEGPSGATVHLQIEGTNCRTEGEVGELTLEFPEFVSWSPTEPELYTLRVDLIGEDGTVDSLSTRFGMREFTVKDERFYLNNRPYHVKCVGYTPHYPRNLKADKLRVLLKRELNLFLDSGFNTLRIEGAPAPTALYELADEMGVLIFAGVADPAGFSQSADWDCAVENLVLRDRNHVSLVAWCDVNVHYPDARPSQALPPSCAEGLRTLDPSRLILCDRGIDGDASLLRPYRETGEAYASLSESMVPPVTQSMKDYLRLSGDPERLNYQARLSVGGVVEWADGSPAGQLDQANFEAHFSARKLDRCFGSVAQFAAASQTMQLNGLGVQLDAIRSNVKAAGYGVESLCDGPSTTPFGLADIKRTAKPVLKSLKQIQQAVRPVVQIYKTNLVPREEVNVTILLINESRLEGRGELSLQVVGPTNQVLWKKKRLVKIPRHGRELWSGEIAASGSPGPHRFVVRLIQDRRVIGENSVDLHVVEPQKPDLVEVNIIGDHAVWRTACGRHAKLHNFLAPIHIVPPLANTIRAYPANELIQAMAQVYEGAVAIVFSPPSDWNDLTEYVGESLRIQTREIVSGQRINHHYAKVHPIFDGLPTRDLMRQPYQNILALRAIEGESDEEMSGIHSAWRDDADGALKHWWGTNITVRRLGAGRVVFTHFRVLEHLGEDPVADRLFVNMLQHFSRRSIPATEVVAADQKIVEWLRRERNTELRKWMVVGTFPNWNGRSGHDTAYPPEANVDFDGTYPGWYRAVRWKSWNSRSAQRHTLDFTAALDGDTGTGAPCPSGTAYAYAEFSCDRRQEVSLNLKGCPSKVWINGQAVFLADLEEHESDALETILCWVKQGKNTLLVKASSGRGPFKLSVEIDSTGTLPMVLNWWK